MPDYSQFNVEGFGIACLLEKKLDPANGNTYVIAKILIPPGIKSLAEVILHRFNQAIRSLSDMPVLNEEVFIGRHAATQDESIEEYYSRVMRGSGHEN